MPATLRPPWTTSLSGGALASTAVGAGCNTPTAPSGLSYPVSSLSLTVGTLMTPRTPTLALGRTADVQYTISPDLPNATLPSISLSPGVRSGTLNPDNHPTPIEYRVPEHVLLVGNDKLNVWTPAGTPPANGWPVFMMTGLAGWFGLGVIPFIDPTNANKNFQLLHDLINLGIAVIWVGINSGGTEVFPPAWFYPPGHASGDWENRNDYMPEHALLDAIQWVKDQGTYDLDPDRICVCGFSAGCISWIWDATYPELALTSGSTQIRKSSAINCAVALLDVCDFMAVLDGWETANVHFESRSTPGSNCAFLLDAHQDVRAVGSTVRIIDVPGNKCAHLPIFFATDEPSSAAFTQFGVGDDLKPLLRNWLGASTHDVWHAGMHCHVLRRIHPSFHDVKSELWVASGLESDLGPLEDEVDGTFTGFPASISSGDATMAATLYPALKTWVVARLTESRKNPAGLHLDPHTGTIFGTPTTTQAATLHTITATTTEGSVTANMTVTVT